MCFPTQQNLANRKHPTGWIGCLRTICWVGFLAVCYLYKIKPNLRKKKCCEEKSGPKATFNLFFLRLGWPWVEEFVGFMVIFTCFPTQQNLVNRKHPIGGLVGRSVDGRSIRLFAIYQILLGWGTYKYFMKPRNFPTQGQSNPRKIRSKVANWATFSLYTTIFSWVGIDFV